VVDLSQARRQPYAHQRVGVEALVAETHPPSGRIYPGCFALFDEMGVGKTKQLIDASQILHQEGAITRVLVVVPNSVRGVWYDNETGELSKHLWTSQPAVIAEYRGGSRKWFWVDGKPWHGSCSEAGMRAQDGLVWLITNYERIRMKAELEALLSWVSDGRTWLVLEESNAVKSHKSIQTKAAMALRRKCVRVTLLNGTPIDNSPADLYSQAAIMDPRILRCKDFYHFRGRYAKMGGYELKQIVGWHDLEEVQERLGPYVLRRLKRDCMDLPDKLEPVTLSVALEPKTWEMYKAMRDEMVAWVNEQSASIATQAGVKAMRLSQICSGWVGGVKDLILDEQAPDSALPDPEIREISSEKTDLLLSWIRDRLAEDPKFRLVVWCRFRPELLRLVRKVEMLDNMRVGCLIGGQSEAQRREALRLLDPETAPEGPTVVAGITSVGSMGITLAAAHTVVHLSNGTSLKHRLQADDRVHRPPQRNVVSYFDVVATGPQGQRTIDFAIVRALRNKQTLADWTAQAWVSALLEE